MQLKCNIKNIGEFNDLGITKVAKLAGISKNTVYRLLHGKSISAKNLVKIAYVLDISLDEMIELDEQEKKRINSKLFGGESNEGS